MEVDEDIDGVLSSQFDALNTRDRGDVIAEFRRLLGPHAASVNEAGCAFWLDMFNWNIHSAVGAFFDWQAPNIPHEETFNMTLCQDFTFADGENISPNTTFQKRWRLKNSGSSSWLPGTALRFIGGGSPMGDRDRFVAESLQPGQIYDMTVTLVSPSLPGQYQGQWRMATPTGLFFGDIIWIVIQVEEGGIMGVTQAMTQLAHDDRASAHHAPASDRWRCSEGKCEEEMSPDDDNSLSPDSGILNPFHLATPSSSSSSSSPPMPPPPQSPPLNQELSTPPRLSPPSSPDRKRLSPESPVFASFSPPSLSPRGPSPHRPAPGLGPRPPRCLLAPPLILPPSPPPFASTTPSVGGFLVPPKMSRRDRESLSSQTVSMSDDDL